MEWNGGSPYMWVSEIEALCKGLSNQIAQGIKEGKEFDKIEVIRKGKVRRAKLNYLRDRVGKAAKVKEIIK